MADRTTSTHSKTLPMDAKTALADLGLSQAAPSPDPAVAAHQGWFAKPDHYQTRIIHSALTDLKGLEGRAS